MAAAPPPDKPGGNTPSTLPDPGEIVLPDIGESEGEGGGEGTETKPTKTPIAVNSSKLAQFINNYAGATEFYVEMQEFDYGKDGSVAQSMEERVARKGENCYVRMTGLDENQKQRLIEILMLKNQSTWDQYLLLRSSKVAVNTGSTKEGDLSLSTLIVDKLPALMWSTKVTVGSTDYYAEVYNTPSFECTICYTASGTPVYQFVRNLSDKQLYSATLYKTIQAGLGTSKNLCALPSDFKTYSLHGKNKITDAEGNVFNVEFQFNSEGELTGFKVLDNTGNDVTAKFKWLNDLAEMRS